MESAAPTASLSRVRLRARTVVWRLAPLAIAVALVSGCATEIERSALPFTSPVIEVAPGAPYQRCLRLEQGERLFFSYRADPAMSFAIRRESGSATVSFVVREASRDEFGIFLVPQTADYCLHWTPVNVDVPWPTLLRFELRTTASQ
jgi:hypothetical protein